MIKYAFAGKTDLESISRLLKKSDLPFSDIRESQVKFIIAKDDKQIRQYN